MLRNKLQTGYSPAKRIQVAFCLILIASLLSCAGAKLQQWPSPHALVPAQHHLSSVPFYPQEDYQCGPAALAMAFEWSGIAVTPKALKAEVYTPVLKGSLQPAMIGAARRHGRMAYAISGPEALLHEVAAGHPVIVLQNLGISWYPVWHYAVVVGYDLDKRIIVMHSGKDAYKETEIRVFNNTWSRSEYWGLLILPPDRLPVTAEETAYVEAVLGLENAGRWDSAVTGYRTALKNWPSNLFASMGIGNSYYSMGDLSSAERSFRETTLHFPASGSAFNNLAQVLYEQGKTVEALKAAKKAVALDGPMSRIYKKTLNEISDSLKGR